MLFVFAISAAFLGAIGVVIESFLVGNKHKNHVEVGERLVPANYVNLLLVSLVLLFWPEQFSFQPLLITFGFLLVIGILDAWYNILYLKALKRSSAIEVNPVIATSPVIILLLSTFLPGVSSSWLIVGVVVLIVLGVYILEFDSKNLLSPFKSEAVKLALAAAFFTAVAAVMIDHLLDNGYASELFILWVRIIIISLYCHAVLRPKFFPKQYKKHTWLFILLGVEMIYVTERSLKFFAMGEGNVALAVAVSSIAPLFVIIFSWLFLKEKITLNKVVGTLVIILGLSLAML